MSTRAGLRHDAPLNAPDGSTGILRTDANEGAFLCVIPLPVHSPRKAALMASHETLPRSLRLVDVLGTGEDSASRRPVDENCLAVSHGPYPTDRAFRQDGPVT
jgi:hypothetical protein